MEQSIARIKQIIVILIVPAVVIYALFQFGRSFRSGRRVSRKNCPGGCPHCL